MLITIKPHSTLASFFTEPEIRVDIDSLTDIPRYLDSMQPAFFNYVRQQKLNCVQEGYVMLDKDLREITHADLYIRRVREEEVIHIVPAVYGGGGKRGGLLSVLALFAFFAIFPIGAGAAGGALGGAASGAAAAGKTVASAAVGGAGGGLFSNLPPFLSNILVNVGLSLLSALFTKKQDSADSATRQNDMFGSLQNSTSSDTPIALHYGMVRTAGQLVSGYIQTVNHARNETVTVDGVIQGIQYNGATGGKGLGSFVLSSSSLFDSDYNNSTLAGKVNSQLITSGTPVGLYGFSNTTNSVATYDIRNTSNVSLLGYSVDNTYMADIRSPVFKSTYAGDNDNALFTLSPTSNAVVAFDILTDAASTSGVLVDNTNLNGVIASDIDSANSVLYVAAADANSLSSVDVSNPTSMSIINTYANTTSLSDVTAIAINNNKTIFATNYSDNSISAYTTVNGVISYAGYLKDNTLLAGARSVAIGSDNSRVYVAAKNANKLVVIDASNLANMSIVDDITATGVIDLAYFEYAGRTKIAAIYDSSTTVDIYDTTGVSYDTYRTEINGVSSYDMPGNCTSVTNRDNKITVTSASANTAAVLEYTEVTEIIEIEREPNITRITRALEPLTVVTSSEYLGGVSNAVIIGA